MPRSASFFCILYFSRVALVVLTCLASALWAQNETILYNFEAFPHGATPTSNLIADAAGNLYGTTFFGGPYHDWLGLDGSGTVFELSPTANGNWTQRALYNFTGGSDGSNPAAGLVFDSAGNLYGVTEYGGDYGCDSVTGCGTVFKLSPGAHGQWVESTIHIFSGYPNDGARPVAGLILDKDGNLYGTTTQGGSGAGAAFELSPGSDGSWIKTILYNFSNGSDGSEPEASLIFDSAGNLYGTAYLGGDAGCGYLRGCGVVFELSPNGNSTWTEAVLHTFEYNDGAFPSGGLASDSAGNFYGTALAGSSGCDGYGCGIVFRLHHNSAGTWSYTILYNFLGGLDGAYPLASVVIDSSGRLYGTTEEGGSSPYCVISCGTVFELTPHAGDRWTERVIHNFARGGSDGRYPLASVVFDQNGNLYGTASEGGNRTGDCYSIAWGEQTYNGCGTVFQLTPASGGRWRSKTLYTFPPTHTGLDPDAGLVSDGSGNLYGVTAAGGKNPCFFDGCGTVFQLKPETSGGWRMIVLHNFNGLGDGAAPPAKLIADKSGNLYGTTSTGGSKYCWSHLYCGGTVFELTPTASGWKETILHKFRPPSGLQGDGASPKAGLVMDSEGSLYGTTGWGGNFSGYNCKPYGCGTVFKLSPSNNGKWREDLLYMFQGATDGAVPYSTLIFDDLGALYGTTFYEGLYGYGTVFKLTPASNGKWTKQILYNFGSQKGDGSSPLAGLVADGKGNLFGTTLYGGNGNYGTVFELSPTGSTWKETVLLAFQGTDGAGPQSTLVFDQLGNLYGVAPNNRAGGCCAAGTAFELSPGSNGWTEHVLHNFGLGNDGAGPNGPLLFDQAGNILGTTFAGGNDAAGTVFKISLGGETQEWVQPLK